MYGTPAKDAGKCTMPVIIDWAVTTKRAIDHSMVAARPELPYPLSMETKPTIPEWRRLIPIAVPAVLSQLAQMSMGVIDTIMSGHHSTEALAAIAIGSSLLHPVIVFFLGLFLAFNPIVSYLRGAGHDHKIGPHFRVGLIMAVALSPVVIGLLLLATKILGLMGVDGDMAALATRYIHATCWGIPAFMMFLALRFCNEGLFSMPAVMASTLLAIPVNIVFNYWFMNGGLGLPEMGAVGVGYATSVVWVFMFLGLLLYTAVTPKYSGYDTLTGRNLPSTKEWVEVVRLGLPMAVTLGFEITMFAAVALLIARYPTEIMAGHQIAINIASLAFMVPLGISQATTARVGYFAGRNDKESMAVAGYTGIGVSVLVMSVSASLMLFLPHGLVSLYTDDGEVAAIAVTLLMYAAIFQFSDGVQVSSAGALRGVKDTKIPMYITAISYWLIGFPTGYVMGDMVGLGVDGYWIGLITGLTVAAGLLLRRWAVHIRIVKQPSVVVGDEA